MAELDQCVSDQHIEGFSRSHGRKWKFLPPYLEMETIIVHDIYCNQRLQSEEERRYEFFSKWKHMKGSRATYRTLINALRKVECEEDAEHIEMLIAQGSAKVCCSASELGMKAPR